VTKLQELEENLENAYGGMNIGDIVDAVCTIEDYKKKELEDKIEELKDHIRHFTRKTQKKASSGICDGNCKEHIGQCNVVLCNTKDKYWGCFSYCESAIEYDIQNGFSVKTIDEF
jgi:hypothetical protein